MRLTPTQVYILRRLSQVVVTVQELRTWDQRPVYGLFRRGMFTLDAKLTAHITDLGWWVLQDTTHAKKRKDSSRPIFQNMRAGRTKRA